MKLLTIIYYLGVAVCGIQGAMKSCHQHKCFYLPASFFAAMGGGIMRDLFLLFIFPVAFTTRCIPDVTIALCAGIIYHLILKRSRFQNIIEHFVILIDSLSIGSFIAIGTNRALTFEATLDIAFCCGVITALGGGILSALICGQTTHNVITTSITYRIITIMCTFLYLHWLSIGINPTVAQYWLILCTFSLISISNYANVNKLMYFRNIIKCFKVMVIITPTIPILYEYNAYTAFISSHLSTPYFFRASIYIQNKNLPYTKRTSILLNFKLLCPRRFTRGR